MPTCTQCGSEQPANLLTFSANGDLVCSACARSPANQAALKGSSAATYVRGAAVCGAFLVCAGIWVALHHC
jgi:hypothetical protein